MSARVALVAGASGDIGRAISDALAAASLDVIGVGRTRERLRDVGMEPIAADLRSAEQRAVVVEAVARRGQLDVLVLGCGIYRRSDDPAVLAQQFAANVEAPYALLRAVLPHLLSASGQVVFINSTQGLSASPGVGQFAATQHAMRAIADSLREEVNPHGVRVTSLFLGRTATTRQATIFAHEGRPYPPERLIQPENVAQIVMMLVGLPATSEVTNITMRPRLKT